jgi:hypothetical protein
MPINSIQCGECGQPLEAQHRAACPWCGSTKRHISVSDTVEPRIDDKAGGWKIIEYFENHPLPLAGVIALTVLSPFVGLAVSGFTGFVVGLIFAVASLIVGFYARTLVREKEPMR